ncbi:MAG: hypothetical protein KC668_08850 [Myxococcales bacterium]|nr:hypothetical protein [Myxococcales bacterium]
MRLQERLDTTNERVDQIAAGLETAKRILGTSLDEAEDRLGEDVDRVRKQVSVLEDQVGAMREGVDALGTRLRALEAAPPPSSSVPGWLLPAVGAVALSSAASWIYMLASG